MTLSNVCVCVCMCLHLLNVQCKAINTTFNTFLQKNSIGNQMHDSKFVYKIGKKKYFDIDKKLIHKMFIKDKMLTILINIQTTIFILNQRLYKLQPLDCGVVSFSIGMRQLNMPSKILRRLLVFILKRHRTLRDQFIIFLNGQKF